MLSIPNQLEGAYAGQNVLLECHTEAYPQSINYWTMEKGEMIISGKVDYFLMNFYIGKGIFCLRISMILMKRVLSPMSDF